MQCVVSRFWPDTWWMHVSGAVGLRGNATLETRAEIIEGVLTWRKVDWHPWMTGEKPQFNDKGFAEKEANDVPKYWNDVYELKEYKDKWGLYARGVLVATFREKVHHNPEAEGADWEYWKD